MTVLPRPVTAIGFPRRLGFACCSTEAKKAFKSQWIITLSRFDTLLSDTVDSPTPIHDDGNMCGRFCSILSPEFLEEILGTPVPILQAPRYNIPPSAEIPLLRVRDSKLSLDLLRWGLIPSWSKELSPSGIINARAETIHEKPSFRDSFRHRRGIVPAAGFYEWKREGKVKTPYFIHRRDGKPLYFAAIWDSWASAGGTLETCAIITTEANDVVHQLHDRMPALLESEDISLWLSSKTHVATLESLLVASADQVLTAYPVSPIVNSPSNDTPECIQKVDSRARTTQTFFSLE